MMLLRYFTIALCCLAFFSSCTNTKKPLSQASIPVENLNVANRKAAAKEYYDNRDYAAALTQWKILRTIDPENTEYKNRISILTALINRRTKLHFSRGLEAMQEKNYPAAKSAFLKALALNPQHSKSLAMLREIETKRVEKIQQKKTARLQKKLVKKNTIKKKQIQEKKPAVTQEQDLLKKGINLYNKNDWSGSIREIEKYLAINEQNQKAKKTLAISHLKLSQLFESRGHLEPAIQHLEDAIKYTEPASKQQQKKLQSLKYDLAENYYVNGIKAYRNDIDRAMTYWEKAISYNPNHSRAIKRLAKAAQVKENLRKINP